MLSWEDLPVTFLQGFAKHLPVKDAATARLTCEAWSAGIPLPRICFSLHQGHSKQEEVMQQHLIDNMQQPGSCVRLAQQCIITLPCTAGSVCSQCQQQQSSQQSSAADCQSLCNSNELLLKALSSMPYLDNLLIKTASSATLNSTSSSRGNSALVYLLQRLMHNGLHQKLQSLTLSLKSWPASMDLNSFLMQLTALKALTLHQCPLAAICSLPSLSHLAELSITGIVSEPVPPSYSFRRQGLLLPQLPGLDKLTLRQLPLDVRVYEAEDIQQQYCQRMQLNALQQQQQQQNQFQAARHSSAVVAAQSGQWIGSSIVCQCPNLRDLRTDMELGPVLLQLNHLTGLHGAHPAWLRAAVAATATTQGDTQQRTALLMSTSSLSSQVQQLRYLAVGVSSAEDLHLISHLKGLRSIRTWQSVSGSTQCSRFQGLNGANCSDSCGQGCCPPGHQCQLVCAR